MKRLTASFTAMLVLTLSSCGLPKDNDPAWAVSLKPGQCGNPVRSTTLDEIAQVRMVDCKKRHGLEVYALVTYQDEHRQKSSVPDAKYPGQEALVRFGREACASRYRTYLGKVAPSPDQYLTFLYPSVSSWTAFGAKKQDLPLLEPVVGKTPQLNRNIVCVVQSAGLENLQGSVRTQENGKAS